MKLSFIVIAILLAMTQIGQADCWDQKQDEINKVKEQVVSVLESLDPKEWNFGSGNDLQHIKILKNKKEITIVISFWGTLTINNQSIDLSDTLKKRVDRLYKKISCAKVFKEVLLMKEFLGII